MATTTLMLASTDPDSDAEYLHIPVQVPVLLGFILRLFAWILESRIIGPFLWSYLKKKNLIKKLCLDVPYQEPPMPIPRFPIKTPEEPGVIKLSPDLSPVERLVSTIDCVPSLEMSPGKTEGFCHWTIQDYHTAYISGHATPSQVADRVLHAVNDSLQPPPGMGIFISCYGEDIIRQAKLSTARYIEGKPLCILDGVPIAIKDEIDCMPYPTSGGSRWLSNTRKVKHDAVCVERLRECGAILIGKTNMHELGAGATGINPHFSASRNPYDRSKCSGGSSGGSAAAVAAGLCPAALGVDGGGSVRIPSALCGVVGFKATFGRISSNGVLPLSWTLGAVGIHAATVQDALIMYTVINGILPNDHVVSTPPAANIPFLKGISESPSLMSNIKFAKYTKWFEDCDGTIKEACLNALEKLQHYYNCKVIEVTIPELEQMKRAHYITMAAEVNDRLGADYVKWGRKVSGMDIRSGFAMYTSFNSHEYLTAQKLRYRQMQYHMDIFRKADIIVTPTTACTAKHIHKDSTKFGELDYAIGAKLMQYQVGANLLGLPAITIPVGYDAQGMPIGIQFMGPPWSEATLLRVSFAMQNLVLSKMRQPKVYYSLLHDVPFVK